MPQQLDLSESPLAEHAVFERRDPLDGNGRSRRNVHGGPRVEVSMGRLPLSESDIRRTTLNVSLRLSQCYLHIATPRQGDWSQVSSVLD